MPSLQVIDGPLAGTLIPLVGERIALGRAPDSDIAISDFTISRRYAISRLHAQISRSDNTYFIEDNQSRNGTYVNDNRIHERIALTNRDRIRICDFVAAYHDEPFGGVPELMEEQESRRDTIAARLAAPLPTEQEWLTSVNPFVILDALNSFGFSHYLAELDLTSVFPTGAALDRKLRLFVCACARRIWHVLGYAENEECVEIAERSADSEVVAEREPAYVTQTTQPGNLSESMSGYSASAVISYPGYSAARAAARAVEAASGGGHRQLRENARAALAALLRDLFRPFRPVTVESAWLQWNAGLVGHLARAAYDERFLPEGTLDVVRLAVLADALEDAGCTHTELLEHLRGPGPHVRGCWAVDLLVNKP